MFALIVERLPMQMEGFYNIIQKITINVMSDETTRDGGGSVFAWRSLKAKMMVTTMALLVFCLLATAYSSLHFSAGMIEKIYEKNARLALDGLRDTLQNYGKDSAKYATVMASNQALVTALRGRDAAAMMAQLEPMMRQAQVDFATVTDSKGVVLLRVHEPQKNGDSLAYQENIQQALQGNIHHAVEPGTAIRLSVRAAAPVRDEQGQVIGTVSTGYNLSNRSDIVDKVKTVFGTEATIFAQDERISTTIMQDGKRVVGSKLSGELTEKILKRQQSHLGYATILGEDFVTAYAPLTDSAGKSIGVLFAGQSLTGYKTDKKDLMSILGIVALLAIGFGTGVSHTLSRKVSGAVHHLVSGTASVAAGDLTQAVKVSSRDELGKLAGHFNGMVGDIKGIVVQVSAQAQNVSAASEELTAGAEHAAKATEDIVHAVADIAQNAQEQLYAVAETETVIGQMVNGIKQAAENTAAAKECARNAARSAEAGISSVEQVLRQMEKIEATVNRSAERVVELGKRSDAIGEIISTIDSIAGQTNLLALNAAIEAARAGAAGRGFAVVADEVRKLAEQSKQAAQQIALLIGETQHETRNAVSAMQDGTREVIEGRKVVQAASDAFVKITDLTEDLSRQVEEISDVTGQLAISSDQVVEKVNVMRDKTAVTLQETEHVSSATEDQHSTMEEISDASRALAGMALEMQEVVRRFRLH